MAADSAASPSSFGGHLMTVLPFPERDDRPIIDIGDYDYYERRAIQKQIVALLLATGKIYKHNHKLVRIIRETDSAGSYTRLQRISAIYMVALVSEVARFRKIDGRTGKWVAIDPPREVISRLMERHGIRELPFLEYKEGDES
jgi:hypothetical protein